MNGKKRDGQKIEPWGAPNSTCVKSDSPWSLMTTCWRFFFLNKK